MKWASAGSDAPQLDDAARDVVAAVRSQLGGTPPDLAVVFVSEHHGDDYDRVPGLIRGAFPGVRLVGCSAGGVVGGGHEIEERPGFSLTAASLPGVTLMPFHRTEPTLPAFATPPTAAVIFPDPFTFDVEPFVAALDAAHENCTTIGGLASGGRQPGANALYFDDEAYRGGCVGLGLAGDVVVDTIVAQGCRPIGEPMFITRAEGNLLFEIDGRPAAAVLQHLFERSSERDQALFRTSLFLGVVMHEARQQYGHGDFLVRNIVGLDPKSGAVAIGATLRNGMVVQFHLRDAETSSEDLAAMLARYRGEPHGSLVFSCLGRGVHLYGAPDHDTTAFAERLGSVPLGGFFCNGEIGPVGQTTFLHGYTSAFGLFRPRG